MQNRSLLNLVRMKVESVSSRRLKELLWSQSIWVAVILTVISILGLIFPAKAHEKEPLRLFIADTWQIHCIALAVYHEAKTEPLKGKIAVAKTVLNRARSRSGRWEDTPCEVIAEPQQFSWYKSGMEKPGFSTIRRVHEARLFIRARWVAEDVFAGLVKSPFEGQPTCFYNISLVTPKWSNWFPVLGQIGPHEFLDCDRRPIIPQT
jgi:N-acetylmuramoyl-L-alanine amidase